MRPQCFRSALMLGGALLLLAASAWPQTRELGSSGELLDGIAAVVDEGVVLKSEVSSSLDFYVRSFRERQQQLPPQQRSQLPPLSVLERQVLDQLVLREIQLQRADRLGIVVSDDMLNQALANVAQNLGITLDQLPDGLAAEGIDYAQYREDSRKDLILRQLEQRDVLSRIAVTPRELEQCLARNEANQTNEFDYNISHILIGVPTGATPSDIAAAREKVEDIERRLDSGEDFGQLAITFSDAQTALDGGALGWRKGAELPTLFADVVVKMQPGDYSDPIQSGSGFQIVKLNEMRGAERVMVDQVRARHILLTPNEILDDDATRQKMIGVRQQIENGDDFGAVALAVSEDKVSATDGGDLGWVEPEQFVPEFAEKLKTLPIGELSEPFRTRFGWHLVEVTDRRSYDSTDELKEQRCQSEIRASKAEEERELWLRRLRDQAFVDERL